MCLMSPTSSQIFATVVFTGEFGEFKDILESLVVEA
jgi:hypothetical protein